MQHKLNQVVCTRLRARTIEPEAAHLAGWGVRTLEGLAQGGRPARAVNGSVEGMHQRHQRESARGDGVEDWLFGPATFSVEQLEDLKLEFDSFACRDGQAGVVGQ